MIGVAVLLGMLMLMFVSVDDHRPIIREGLSAASSLAKEVMGEDRAQKACNNVFSMFDGNTGTPVPLPSGQLFMFAGNEARADCCAAPYSASSGCVCMSPEQGRYLSERGGNNTLDTDCVKRKSC